MEAFSRGSIQTYRLDESFEASTNQFLFNWIYRQVLEIDVPQGSQIKGRKQFNIIPLWILADCLLIPSLQNQVIPLLYKVKKEHGCPSSLYAYIYDNTSDSSPLRKFCIYLAVNQYIKKGLTMPEQ
jgi:hypothetical protein